MQNQPNLTSSIMYFLVHDSNAHGVVLKHVFLMFWKTQSSLYLDFPWFVLYMDRHMTVTSIRADISPNLWIITAGPLWSRLYAAYLAIVLVFLFIQSDCDIHIIIVYRIHSYSLCSHILSHVDSDSMWQTQNVLPFKPLHFHPFAPILSMSYSFRFDRIAILVLDILCAHSSLKLVV